MKIDDKQVIEVKEKKPKVKKETKPVIKTQLKKVDKDVITKNIKEKVKKDEFNSNGLKYLIVFFLGVFVAFGVFYCFMNNSKSEDGVTLKEETLSVGIDKVYDAVVYIENYKGTEKYTSGTGFIYKKDKDKAYILTNYHVVGGGTSIKITLSDDSVVSAKFLGGDKYLDIACLAIDNKYVKQVAKLGSSSKTPLGSTLFTVGSPVGDEYRGTVTRGILSGKDRMISVAVEGNMEDYVMKVIQTDAAMNPGNSGGPLCTVNGEVIGINSMKLVKNEVEGMGFAISIEAIKNHLSSFEQGNNIVRPYLGIAIFNLDNKEAVSYYGFDNIKTKLEKGIVVQDVQNDSCAFNKLKSGDIITMVDGVKVESVAYLRYELFKNKVGDKVIFTVERDGVLKDISLMLKTKNDK